MEHFRIALAQLEPRLFDKAANLEKAERCIRQAASQGAAFILFPELYLTGYSLAERAVEMAEPLHGNSVRRVAEIARQQRIAVGMGFAELSGDGSHAYDALCVVDARGGIAGCYRKMHLYQAEKGWFVPGEEPCGLDFGLDLTGLLICYDLEFPEAPRDLALRGARWVAVSTGNMLPNQHLQEVYVQSRAAENRLWVAVANRLGREGETVFFGGSAVSDPYGELVARAGSEETLLFADIDLTRAAQASMNADYLRDRRPDLYHKLVEP